MKNKLTLLIIILFPIFVLAQETNCSDFKTGTFANIIDGKPTGTIIKRDSKFQTEINEERGIEAKDKVQWINDCSYKLISQDKTHNYPNLIIKITETGNDYYLYEVSMESDSSKLLKGKMVRVK